MKEMPGMDWERQSHKLAKITGQLTFLTRRVCHLIIVNKKASEFILSGELNA
jgi:hypothetical protein